MGSMMDAHGPWEAIKIGFWVLVVAALIGIGATYWYTGDFEEAYTLGPIYGVALPIAILFAKIKADA